MVKGGIRMIVVIQLQTDTTELETWTSVASYFADDTSILVRGANNEESIETALLEAGEWFGGNRLKLNDLKTKKLRISTTITKNEEQEVKFLGLVLTSSLNWSRHVDNLRGTLASAIFSIRRLQQTATYEASRSAYFAMFESRATYGILLWGASSAMETIFRLQKEAVRALAGPVSNMSMKPRKNLSKMEVSTLTEKFHQIPKLIHDSVSPNKQELAHYKPPCNKTLQSTSRRDEGHVQTKISPSGQGVFGDEGHVQTKISPSGQGVFDAANVL
ncbi:hypothetical protein QE152_g37389 [Popillia japonica]|uniref:Reverse transcriptase domain-containing protein n=1 Tax=Popillia japonica TaxID=7064 RepID=A0AAW1IAG3_POPJA